MIDRWALIELVGLTLLGGEGIFLTLYQVEPNIWGVALGAFLTFGLFLFLEDFLPSIYVPTKD